MSEIHRFQPQSVVIDGTRYVPADDPKIVDTPDLDWNKWIPQVGDVVWANHDSGAPMGKVVGYVHHPGQRRHGQPVIERIEDHDGFLGWKKGDRTVCHPMFLWPFEPGSPEHEQAEREGRFA